MTEQELQALRNITREYMRAMRPLVDDVESITCVREALKVLKAHNFKQDRPL